jgi:hypothetical protein
MSIEVSILRLAEVQKAFKDSPQKVNQILARAINRTTTNVKTNMAKKAAEHYEIKQSDIKTTIDITKAVSTRPSATVRSAGQHIDLTKFKISPDLLVNGEHDYSVQVLKADGKKAVPGFASGFGLFRRTGSSHLPISRLMGPSVPQMIDKPNAIAYIESEARTMLDKRLKHELERSLGAKKA